MAMKKREWIQPEQRLANLYDVAISRSAVVPEQLLPISFERDPEAPLPAGWEKCLDMQTGRIYFKDWNTQATTSRDPRDEQHVWSSAGLMSSSRTDESQRSCAQAFMAEKATTSVASRMSPDDYSPSQQLRSWSSRDDDLPSLELSLRCDASQAQDTSNWTSREILAREKAIVAAMDQCQRNFLGLNYSMGPFTSMPTQDDICHLLDGPSPKKSSVEQSYFPEKAAHALLTPKIERQDSETLKCADFLGLNFNMGPFSSSSSVKVKEEVISSSLTMDQFAAAATPQSTAFPEAIRERREVSPISSKGEVNVMHRARGDFLALNFNMGPFSSNSAEAKVACTLEKIEDALRRSNFNEAQSKRTTKSGSTQYDSRASGIVKSNHPSFPRSPPSPLKFSPRSPSPATSDDASSSSSSSNSPPSVMSFQGEELDDPRRGNRPIGDRGATVLVTVGCTRCLMFVMLSKADPTCPRCGNTGLLEILPDSSARSQQKKRQRVEKRTPCDGDGC